MALVPLAATHILDKKRPYIFVLPRSVDNGSIDGFLHTLRDLKIEGVIWRLDDPNGVKIFDVSDFIVAKAPAGDAT